MNAKKITKKIRVKIRSAVSAPSNFNDRQIFSALDACANDGDEFIEFLTDGRLSVKGDLVEITYKESKDLGMSDIESTLRFKKTLPNMVNLIRRGAAPASLIFDSEIYRRNCSYSIGNIPFNFCVCTNEVVNEAGENDGKIILDYDIESRGVKVQRNVFTIEYKAAEESL